MVRYLKLIVLVFGSIGLLFLSFFYFQNKTDINLAFEYKDRIDYDALLEKCTSEYVYPCMKSEFEEFLSRASLTGISIGLKFVFNIMDIDKEKTPVFKTQNEKDMEFALNYIEINNMALKYANKKYHGFKNLYGGYLATLGRFYDKGYSFSDNLLIGLESSEGLVLIQDEEIKKEMIERLSTLKENYLQIKLSNENFLENEMKKYNAKSN